MRSTWMIGGAGGGIGLPSAVLGGVTFAGPSFSGGLVVPGAGIASAGFSLVPSVFDVLESESVPGFAVSDGNTDETGKVT